MSDTLTADAVDAARQKLVFRTEAFIDGGFTPAASGKTFASINPATEEELAQIAACDHADIDRAVTASRQAFDSGVWSKLAPDARKQAMLAFADHLEAHTLELAVLEALDSGKPVNECHDLDVPDTINSIRWHAEAIDKTYDAVAPVGDAQLAMIVREPVGVVATVLPWNFPLMMAGWKLGPALATGNSVIVKPAEQTSLTTLRLAELAFEAGIPAGVLNVVPGLGESAGQALGMHDDVDMVSFTGSTDVGRLFLQYAAQSNLKRVALECGGKNPQIVMDDIEDIEHVAAHVVEGAFWNMGENCSAGSRLLVHHAVKDRLLDAIEAELQNWPVGDPLDPATKLGPLIERAHHDKVLAHIAEAKDAGYSARIGGGVPAGKDQGYYVEPTIFDAVAHNAGVARDEIFGPVLAVVPFETEAEAIQIANDTPYGLAASLWTQDFDRAHRMARAIRAGTVAINCFSEGDATTPFGGYKQSGFSSRDKSAYAQDQYCELKTIWAELSV